MKLFYNLLLFSLFTGEVHAQFNVNTDQQIDLLVTQYNSLFFASKNLVSDLKEDNNFVNQNLINDFLDERDLNLNNINNEAGSSKLYSVSNFGLKWVSDYTQNFGLGGSDDEDIYFKSKVSTGVDWVILGEGSFFKHKTDARLNQLEVKKDSLELLLLNNDNQYQKKLEVVKYIYEIHRIELLKKLQLFLNERMVYSDKLFKANLLNNADRVKIQNDYLKIKGQIELSERYLSKENNSILLDKYWNIPKLNLNLPGLETEEVSNLIALDSEIIEIQKEILRKDRKNSDRPSLRTKFRYNVFNLDGAFNRSYASIGASLSVPIRFGKDQALEYKIKSYESKLENQKLKTKERLQKIHYDFYFYKNQLDNLQYDLVYLDAVLDNEIQVYKKHNLNFSPEKYIEASLQFLKKKLEILDVNQKLTENFISYKALLGVNKNQDNVLKNSLNFDVVPVGDEKTSAELVSTDNSIQVNENYTFNKPVASYMWSDTFKLQSNEKLFDVIIENNVKSLFLSPGETSQEKLKEFISLVKQNNISIHRLIGENSYAKNDLGIKKLLRKLNHLDLSSFNGIHLDIEPHTFSDYRENLESYVANMNTIFTMVKQFCDANNLELSVSVPMNLSEKNAKILKKEKIKTFIMAYENTDQTKLLKRTEKLRNILKNQFVWVLRLSDFESKSDLNDALNELEKNKISEIGFYDVSALLNEN